MSPFLISTLVNFYSILNSFVKLKMPIITGISDLISVSVQDNNSYELI